VAEENEGSPQKRHTPGRDHVRKSGPRKKKRFQQKAAKKREEEKQTVQADWNLWESLPPEVQKLRPDLRPRLPRPIDES
jgi:hypothetical protein